MSDPSTLTEVVPGIQHWSANHPSHGSLVHSHYLTEQRAAIEALAGFIEAPRSIASV